MNILHLDYDDFQNIYAGGQAKATYEINKRLSKKHTITVLTGNYPGAKRKTVDGIIYRPIGIGWLGSSISLLTYWLLLPFYVLFLQKDADIILEFFTAPFSVSLVPWIAKKPLVAVTTFFHADDLTEKYNLPFDYIQQSGIRRYTHIIALNDALRRRIQKIHPKASIYVIPRGIDMRNFPQKKQTLQYALYVGRLDIFQKGIDYLITAWTALHKTSSEQKLIIAGTGKRGDQKKLKSLLQKYNLDQSIETIGAISGKEKYDLLSHAAVVVCPSRFESFGISALEALASGRPLVCFDIEGFSWIPDDCCIKVPPYDTIKLSHAIQKFLRGSKLEEKITQRARKFASTMTWEKVAREYETIYKDLVE